jgi:hypothetical protein
MMISRVKGGLDAIGAGPAGAIVLFMAGVRSVCRVGGRYLSTESDKRTWLRDESTLERGNL